MSEMQRGVREYEVSSIEDVDKIPPDRREIFLREARPFFRKQRIMRIILELLGIEIVQERLTWVDDGKQDISVSIDIRDKEVQK